MTIWFSEIGTGHIVTLYTCGISMKLSRDSKDIQNVHQMIMRRYEGDITTTCVLFSNIIK